MTSQSSPRLYTIIDGNLNGSNGGGNGHNHTPLPAAGRNGNGRNHAPARITGRNLAHSHRTASQRGAIAAQVVLKEVEPVDLTMIQAAAITGANIPYVQAALRLTPEARERVAAGKVGLTEVTRANGLLAAWTASTSAEKAALGAAVGIDCVWDAVISPLI